MVFPLAPAPPNYARCSFPNNRCGVFYPGDPILLETTNGAATGYTVRDYYGTVIKTGTLTPVTPPPLNNSHDLAIAAVSWFEPNAVRDTAPTFTPAGVGTNQFGDSTNINHWKISSSYIPLPSSAAQSFLTSFDAASGWSGGLVFIKSSGSTPPSVVQTALGIETSPTTTITLPVGATSTNSLLVLIVNTNVAPVSVTDSAGNTWTRQAVIDGTPNGLECSAVYTTTVANPASITTVTVTMASSVNLCNFAFYEISGANNTSPVDLATCNFGFGSGAVLSTAAASRQFTIPTLGKYGWFRVYLTGPSSDFLFGPSYGATNICLVRSSSNFKLMPAVGADYATNNGARTDPAMKAIMGIGSTRYEINNVNDPASIADVRACIDIAKNYFGPSNDHLDPLRDQEQFVEFPNGSTSDFLIVHGNINANGGWNIYPLNQSVLNGANIYVTVTPGTNSNTAKLKVFYPDNVTLVETFDNLPNSVNFSHIAVNTINASSLYVRAYTGNDPLVGTDFTTPTALGNTNFLAVKAAVQALYPDVTRFEGPSNEPRLDFDFNVQKLRLFVDAVHAGNASAIAIGPCPVQLDMTHDDSIDGIAWQTWLSRGGGAIPDEFSIHDYNSMQLGDLNLGRFIIATWQALNITAGFGSKPIWQTEAGQAYNSVFGVYHPRRARVSLHHTLLWEQYGVPRERNSTWYDFSHGFWSIPAFLEHADTSLNPQAALYRVLAEETYAKAHQSILDFGTIGNAIFFGSIYQATDTSSVAVILSTSALPTPTSAMVQAQVVLTVSGTSSPLTYSDPFGNTTTLPIVNGRVTMPISELPSYLRLPAGVSVTPYACNDWAPIASAIPNLAGTATGLLGGIATPAINDGLFSQNYSAHTGLSYSTASMPSDTCELRWVSPVTLDHVIVWCGSFWQIDSALTSFDVQTYDGATWTTRATVTKAISSFQFGTDSFNAACARETYADEQWIFDVRFPTISCVRVRILAHTTSYGGEPDLAAKNAGGQGSSIQQLVIQEFAAMFEGNYVPPPLPPTPPPISVRARGAGWHHSPVPSQKRPQSGIAWTRPGR